MNSSRDSAFHRQVFSLPDLIEGQYADLEPRVRKVLTTPEIFSIQRIVLTGCGDSYAASLAIKHAFELLTGLPTEVVPALELARLYSSRQLGFAPNNPLVIAISNSGEVARVVEAVRRSAEAGAFTLGITSNLNSPMALGVHRTLKLDIPPFDSAPGTRTYLTAVMALLLLAIRIGEVRSRFTMDTAMDMRFDMLEQARLLRTMLPSMESQIRDLAAAWNGFPCYDFVGAGFDLAAAWYGQAKILEAVGKPALVINSEEWMHLNVFLRSPTSVGTVLVANTTNPCHSRNQEVVSAMVRLGRPVVLVTDGELDDFGVTCPKVTVPRSKYPISMPLTQFAPLALLASELQTLSGERDGRGLEGPWDFCANGAGLKNSKIVVNV